MKISSRVRSSFIGGTIAIAITSALFAIMCCNVDGADTDTSSSVDVVETLTTLAYELVTTTNAPTTTKDITTTTTNTSTTTSTIAESTTTIAESTTTIVETNVATIETTVATVEETQPTVVEVSTLTSDVYYFEGTFYCATAMHYTSTPYGASGDLLTSGYSVASNYFPFGTRLWVESDYISGEFIVQDCGGMAYNVVDFYFWDYSNVPSAFAYAGRIPITVTVIE